jgi:hypothetical protein
MPSEMPDIPTLVAWMIAAAVHYGGHPEDLGGEEIDAVFAKCQGNRSGSRLLTFDDEKRLIESALERAKELIASE